MSTITKFAPVDHLLYRLRHAIRSGRQITILAGSGITAPDSNRKTPGVPAVGGMIEKFFQQFPDPDERKALEKTLLSAGPSSRYQAATEFIIQCRGQPSLNDIIKGAVLESRNVDAKTFKLDSEFENDLDGWYLRPAVEAIGQLIAEHRHAFQKPLLTSNFDPLLEIAIKRAGHGALAVNLPDDGSFQNLVVSPNQTQVVHFHGYWSHGDTLHTPDQLTRERPKLTASLQTLLRETTLVVIGYGGWKDVFTTSLLRAIREQSDTIDVLWAFYSNDEKEISITYNHLLQEFSTLPGQRVVPYKGVDCHSFLPELRSALSVSPTGIISTSPVGSAPGISSTEATTSSSFANITTGMITHPSRPYFALKSSPPKSLDWWVGRSNELAVLVNSKARVIAIHGMAGFGKSSLAAQFFTQKQESHEIDVSFWADCREQGNTVQSHLVTLIERLSEGAITAASLQKATTIDVIDLVFQKLSNRKTILVLDNIDHYVDLEANCAIGTLHGFIERVLGSSSNLQVILTSRPRLFYPSDFFESIETTGLNRTDIEKLFELRKAPLDSQKKIAQLDQILAVTHGSPLFANLIATQVANGKTQLNTLLEKLHAGLENEGAHQVLDEVWNSLKEDHQILLRHLAELTHADTEDRIANCVAPALNRNRFGKAMKSLKALNLVIIKSRDLIELHPLIKSFIRQKFKPEEQIGIVDRIIGFFDRIIGRFRTATITAPEGILDNWTSKIELCVANGRAVRALADLNEIQGTLRFRGYIEEFVRLAEMVIPAVKPSEEPKERADLDTIYSSLIYSLGYFARNDRADYWLDEFTKTVEGKSARYILLCEMRSHSLWLRGEFNEAARWALEGVELKTASQVDTNYDCQHNLALAQRDSGFVEPALKFFLRKETLERVLNTEEPIPGATGPYYGNIGRCLQFLDRKDDALKCVRMSAQLIEREDTSDVPMNRGYAARWIGELLTEMGEWDAAYIAFRRSVANWKLVSPIRASEVEVLLKLSLDKLTDASLASCGDWEAEELFLQWLKYGKL